MIPYHTSGVAEARIREARETAEARRLRWASRTGLAGSYGAGVIDALGHGLIAIGSRLVSNSPSHARRAA
ncbi:MAG TPA: hypothetical protein VHL52_02285 [Acidimicrobiia bacterium]|nr:hypothetical protein [Acidimicrobiia bacterium]